jgi:hypothetical protein
MCFFRFAILITHNRFRSVKLSYFQFHDELIEMLPGMAIYERIAAVLN